MSLIKRWRASPKNLVGPDLRTAPWVEISLSGGLLRFKNPPVTMMIPKRLPLAEVDIYCDDLAQPPVHDCELAKGLTLLMTGWDFYSGISSGSAIGGLTSHLILFRVRPHVANDGALLSTDRLIAYTLADERASANWLDRRLLKAIESGDSRVAECQLYQYPKSADELAVKVISGSVWLSYRVHKPGRPGRIMYRTAIGSEHYLDVVMEPDCYQDDYYSPAHNMQEVVPKTIEEFMQHMYVQLSPEAQRQYDEINRVGTGTGVG